MSCFRGPVVLSLCACFTLVSALKAAEKDTAAHPLPTPRQWKIMAALDEATELDFADVPLSDVIAFVKQKHEIEIQLDSKALTDAGVGSDTPITRHLDKITLRSALRLILSEIDLTYLVGDGYLMITSKTEAENLLSTKVYPVRDLVTLDSEFRPPLAPGEKAVADFRSLIDLIASTVAPTTWDEVGGPGSIKGFEHTQAIAISQTNEVHEEIAELLAALRSTRDKQLAAAKPADPVAERQPNKDKQHIKVYRLVRQTAAETPAAAANAAALKAPGGTPAAGDKSTEAKDSSNATITAKVAIAREAETKLDAWAEAIARLVPQIMIDPPFPGEGVILAVGDTVVVRQTDEIQHLVGKLINEMLPGSVPASMLAYYPAVRLTLPPGKVNWPHEAEPQQRGWEARINEALDEPTELDFADQPLSDVIAKLTQQHEIVIQLDTKALADAGVGSDSPITRSIKGVSLRTALKVLLDELDLTYVVRNEVLIVTSKTESENMLTTKVYPVFDLVVRPPDAPATARALDFPSLIDNIQSSIEPTTWNEVGGPGAIQSFTNAGALVISQTTEAHEQIVEYLRSLREVGAEQK